jgi:cyanuric acid amidohydrolase
MPIAKVHRISAGAPDDVSGIEAAIAGKRINAAGVIAVLGKTEGNGLVNDFSRGFATLALKLLFQRYIAAEEAEKICLIMSGGTEGGMAPHWIVFERSEGADGQRPALAIGRAHTAQLPFDHLGRLQQVDAVAAGVRAAMQDAGIVDAGDVHFRADQMPAAHRPAHWRGGTARCGCGCARHTQVHGFLARSERFGCRGCAWRDQQGRA